MRYGTSGMSFPFRLDASGRIAVSDVDLRTGDVAHIKDGLVQLFGTRKGERFFRRDFGDELDSLLFRPNSPNEVALWESERRGVLERWEPRVTMTDLKITLQQEHYLSFRMSFLVEGVNISADIGPLLV